MTRKKRNIQVSNRNGRINTNYYLNRIKLINFLLHLYIKLIDEFRNYFRKNKSKNW